MSIEKAKAGFEIAKIAVDIWAAIADRRAKEKEKEQAKRIAELEAEVARLKAGK